MTPRAARGRLARDLDTVGTHIGDQANGTTADIDALVEPLGDVHGAPRPQSELARRLLLKGRGREGRPRVARALLGLDGRDAKARRACDLGDRGLGGGLVG